MTDGRIPRRAAHVAWTEMDGCIYAVALASPAPFTVVGLSETGSSIWMHVDGVAPVPTIARLVADEWGVRPEDVADGLPSFLQQLAAQHLVVWDASVAETSTTTT